MNKIIIIFYFFSTLLFAKPLPTPSNVEIDKYVGKWYTITALPQVFSLDCVGQTAEYEILSKNSIDVLNTCIKKDGTTRSIHGVATVVNHQTNAELEVVFDNQPWKKGDYTIVLVDENYEFAMVGSKDRKSLWILARETFMPKDILSYYLKFAQKVGFDISKLQSCNYP